MLWWNHEQAVEVFHFCAYISVSYLFFFFCFVLSFLLLYLKCKTLSNYLLHSSQSSRKQDKRSPARKINSLCHDRYHQQTMGGSTANLLEEVRATKRDITTAHTTLTTHFNTFLALAEQLEGRLKEVEGREAELEKRENKLKSADQQHEERDRKSLAREKEVEERERSVVEKEARWKEAEERMKANAARLPTVIKLNISM